MLSFSSVQREGFLGKGGEGKVWLKLGYAEAIAL